MFFRSPTRRASTIVEFVLMFLVVMGTMLIFQKAFMRAIAGRWKAVGDSYGFGRQYSPTRTFECAWAMHPTCAVLDDWYSVSCADAAGCQKSDFNCLATCFDAKCD